MVKFASIKMFNLSEDEIDFDSFIKFSGFCYKLLFFDFAPLSRSASRVEKIKYACKINYFRFCMSCLILCIAELFAFAFLSAKNFVEATVNVPNIVTVSLIVIKSLANLFHREDIRIIFQDLRQIFSDRGNGQNGKYKVKKYLDGYHRFIKIYASSVVMLYIPVVFLIVSYMYSGIMTMTVNYWYPFDIYQRHTFPIALAWTNYLGFIGLAHMLAAEAMLFALITVLAMEFDILKQDLIELKFTQPQDRLKTVKSLIDRHSKLLQIGDQLQNIFGITFLCHFVISSLEMCFIAFLLLSIEADVAAYAFYVPYLGMVVGQTLLLCIFGQKICDASQEVSEGVYNCGWEEMKDVSFKKHLILILLRSQRAMKLTAMKFADISLESFTTVS